MVVQYWSAFASYCVLLAQTDECGEKWAVGRSCYPEESNNRPDRPCARPHERQIPEGRLASPPPDWCPKADILRFAKSASYLSGSLEDPVQC
jgi:hypothetical protein